MNTDTLTIPAAVRHLGLQATWELSVLLQSIVEHTPLIDAEDQRPLVVRGLALRAASLNSVLMSVLNNELPDSAADLRKLQRLVLGEAAVADEEATSVECAQREGDSNG